MTPRLSALPVAARVGIAGFVFLVIGLHAAAQATLWVRDGGGSLPGPEAILGKYHGRPDQSRLHEVLDLGRPDGDPRTMYWYLDRQGGDGALERIRGRRTEVLAWVEAGTPDAGWPRVEAILRDDGMCLQCHGLGGERQDLPLETLEDVRRVAQPGQRAPLAGLLVSAHNHVFGFAVLALLLSLGVAFTLLPARLKVVFVVTAFAGAALDVGAWFLTRALGAPWHYAVLLGGAAFGLATALMAAAILDEVLLRGRLAGRLPGSRS